MLSLAASSAGLPLDWLDRVARVEQPAVSGEVQAGFHTQFLAMQAATVAAMNAPDLPLIYRINTAGTAWLLLAFPGGTEADARRMFTVKDSDTGADGVLRIALAGPAYTGVAVLASCLLGTAPVHHVTGEQQDGVFWREACTHIDPNEWSFGCFKTRDQLLPAFLIHVDGCTVLSSRDEGQSLKRQVCLLQSRSGIQAGQLARLRQDSVRQISRVREAARSRERRRRRQDNLAGHTQVEVTGPAQPHSSLLSIDFHDQEAEEERLEEKLIQCGQKRKRGAGIRGEMGVDTLLVIFPGPKRHRLSEDGTRPGGIHWNDRVMLCAALTRTLGKSSLAQAGSAGLDFMARGALAVYVKAQPLRKNKSRRVKKDTPVAGLVQGISEASLRYGITALELAKSDALIECIRDSHSLFLGYDSSTVANLSLQIVSWRAIKIVTRFIDGAGTCKLGGDSRSGSFDLHALGGKRVTEFEIQNEDGSKRVTSIEAADRFGAQLHHAGVWEAATRHPSLTTVSDGGTEAIGKGNRDAARLNMAGENSVVYRTFLQCRSGNDGRKWMNEIGLWVPLQEAFGFDPLSGDFCDRKPEGQRLNTVKKLRDEAIREYRKNAGKDNTANGTDDDGSSDDDGEIVTISDVENASSSFTDAGSRDNVNRQQPGSRPIYDPLRGPQEPNAPPIAPMSITDFFAWDIASAYPWLGLEERMDALTEDMVASVELFVGILIDEACKEVDKDKFKAISLDGFKSLSPNRFVGDQAITLILEDLTRVLGGRFVGKGGTYTTGPVSPLIQPNKLIPVDDATKALYVLDPVNAARLIGPVLHTERHAPQKGQLRADRMALKALADMVAVFKGSKRPNRRSTVAETERKQIVFERGSGVFAFTHLPGHYVSTEVDNLSVPTEVEESGQGSSRNAVTITRADSNSQKPSFCGQMHEALHIALKALGAIGETQDVDHVGLPLPPQDRPDCAFYVLLRLITKLSGESPPPRLWPFITRILRCWTGLQGYRRLLEDGAVVDVREIARSRFDSIARQALAAHVQHVASPELPIFQQNVTVRGPGQIWTQAIAGQKDFEEQTRKAQAKRANAKVLDRVLKDVSKQAESTWTSEAREIPKQLPTGRPVMACSTPPARVRAGGAEREQRWKRIYHVDTLPRVSMQKNPARYFLMAERDKRVQDKGRRAFTNPLSYWCLRHRGHLASMQTLQRTDRLRRRSERAINFVNNPCSWPHLKEHMHAYLDLAHLGGRDSVKPSRIHEAVQVAMKSQIETYGPPAAIPNMSGESERDEARQQTCYDVLRKETSKTLRLTKPKKVAETRWGTIFKALRFLDTWARPVSAAVIHVHGQGTEEALEDNVQRLFCPTGYVDPHTCRLPRRPGLMVHTLCNSTDVLFFAIGGFVDAAMISPMMDAMSHNLECSRCSVCGIDSFFRRLLHFLNGHLFVGMFNSGDSFTGSDAARARATKRGLPFLEYQTVKDKKMPIFNERRKTNQQIAVVKLAHRSVASLREAYKRPFLINPKADVKGVFGRFCSGGMVKCVHTLLAGLRRAAMSGIDRPGPWIELRLYPTLEQKWGKEVAPSLKNDHMASAVDCVPNEKTQRQRFVRNMMKAQWAFTQIVADMIEAILKWFDRELFCPLGFIACAIQTRTVRARKEENGSIVDVLIANKFALANLAVAFKMLDELKEHYPGENLANYLPAQLAALLNDEVAMQQAGRFCLAENIEGFVLVDKDGKDVLDRKGNQMPVGPAPVERFSELAHLVCTMALTVLTNNDPERAFTHASRGYRLGGRNVTAMTISSWVRAKDWISGGLWGMEKNEDFIKQYARWRKFVADYYPLLQKLTMPDAHSAEEARMAAQLANLPAKYKKGAQFLETNIMASKDLFIFGSKPGGKRDDGESPDSATGGLSSPVMRLRQRARAMRALRKGKITPTSGVHRAAQAKRRKIAQDKSLLVPPPRPRARSLPRRAPAASDGVSEGAKPDGHSGNQEQDDETVMDGEGSGQVMYDEGSATVAAEESGGLADPSSDSAMPSPPSGMVDHETAADAGGNVVSDATPSSESDGATALNTGVSGGTGSESTAGGQSEEAGPAKPRNTGTKLQAVGEHKCFIKAREWLASSKVKDAKKAAKQSAKKDAEKDAASLRVAASSGAGCSPRSDAAGKHPSDESSSDSDSDAVWTPSTVTDTNFNYITVTQTLDGTTCRLNRTRQSGCLLHLILDALSGESQLVQVQRVWYERKEKEHKNKWMMEYSRVYSVSQALVVAEQDADKTVVVGGRSLVQRGRDWLRENLRTGKLLHHIGDVRLKLCVTFVLGVCAWLPASALLCDAKGLAERKEELRKNLYGYDGISMPAAQLLAEDPIYLGENFSEAIPEQCSDSDRDSSESESEGDKTAPAEAIMVQQPSRQPLRRLRVERGERALFEVRAEVENSNQIFVESEDSDDTPLVTNRSGVGGQGFDGPSNGSGAEEEGVRAGRGRGRGRSGASSGAAAGDGAGKGEGGVQRRGPGRFPAVVAAAKAAAAAGDEQAKSDSEVGVGLGAGRGLGRRGRGRGRGRGRERVGSVLGAAAGDEQAESEALEAQDDESANGGGGVATSARQVVRDASRRKCRANK